MNHFFMPMQLPNKTFQDKILARGRIINSPEVKDIQDMFLGHLHQHKPVEPVPRGKAVHLSVILCWQADEKRKGYKTTKPDVDNFMKLLMDSMTKSGFWADDSQVAHLRVMKVFDSVQGIDIEWGVLPDWKEQ